MSKHMLIDATHPEETRVAVVDGKRLEEFDVEIASRKPLKGNIYLAKVTRVEPSLQAAFVEYGGNRHGFLAFSEIHPDYYRIPIADREALKRETSARYAAEERAQPHGSSLKEEAIPAEINKSAHDALLAEMIEALPEEEQQALLDDPILEIEPKGEDLSNSTNSYDSPAAGDELTTPIGEAGINASTEGETAPMPPAPAEENNLADDPEADEERARKRRLRALRRYKIQEVIKRRQIMLVQVTKEERGNKGAALTTYLSLAGRYCVLMPNTDRGGGISRRITNPADRKRLKNIIDELDAPAGMAVILRTAGSERSKIEIRRDYEYLIRLWDEIRELTLKSTAPALIYEEADLIKRSIRDLYSRDIEDVIVAGDDAHKAAKDFMRMLMPSHAKRVRIYKDQEVPLFQRYQIESQIAAIHDPIVQLKSGGYIVLNQTEALVAIDVNSGKSTRERNIEETALRTNLEAADEIARQLRLRDLAGLIVIDFIDMDEGRHNSAVEKRLKEALRNDRARIQLGRISMFGLMEMSRQRLNPSLAEASTGICPHCNGTGRIRSVDSTALHILRIVEEEITRQPTLGANVFVPAQVALYILNQKRHALASLEARHGTRLYIMADDSLVPPAYRLEKLRELAAGEEVAKILATPPSTGRGRQKSVPVEEENTPEPIDLDASEAETETEAADMADDSLANESDGDRDPRRRRRRGRRGGRRRSSKRREDGGNSVEDPADASFTERDSRDRRPKERAPKEESPYQEDFSAHQSSDNSMQEDPSKMEQPFIVEPTSVMADVSVDNDSDENQSRPRKRGWWKRLVE